MNMNRREFLQTSMVTSSALVIGFSAEQLVAATPDAAKQVNPFVLLGKDGSVTVVIKHFEMGQGTTTGLATLVAEEMDADWAQIKTVFAPADNERYKNLFWGIQGTGGSSAIANAYMQYRKAGAMARELLTKAAAQVWKVPVADIKVANGQLSANGKQAGFGDFASLAATLKVSDEPILKTMDQFKLIGKQKLPRNDQSGKVNGTAQFAMDARVSGMQYVVVLRAPLFGGKLSSFDDSKARKVSGFIDAKALPDGYGVAVYAKNTWAAFKSRKAIDAQWDLSAAETRGYEEFVADHKRMADKPQLSAQGTLAETEQAINSADQQLEIDFLLPHLAHAPMEPLNCLIEPTASGIRLYDGCQAPGMSVPQVAKVLDLKVEQVEVETLYAGGSFGRRATPTADYQVEAAQAFKLAGGKTPVKLVWDRQDDLHGGYYRPMAYHRVKVGLTSDKQIAGWDHRIVTQPLSAGSDDKVPRSTVEGIAHSLYGIPNMSVGVTNFKTPVTPLWWRSVGHTHTAFAMESVIDMLAAEASKDPLEYRLSLLDESDENQQRLAGVLREVKKVSGWKTGDKRGVAAHFSFKTWVAVVADVSVENDVVTVNKLHMVVDCGVAVNPDVIRAQMEGGAGYALGSMLRNEITFDKGRVEQNNFPDYVPLRMPDMPEIEVSIVASDKAPSGVGEPGVPPTLPAVANAIFAQTGKRLQVLPLTRAGYKLA